MGSHGFPGWFWTALDKIKAGDYGQTDARETFDDATQLAIRDQERAGVDVICDGEMRRFFFVQTFYAKMEGLDPIEPLRKTGLYAYDSVPRYRPVEKIRVPQGLGVVDEFRYLKTQTDKPVKATCPGPVTLSIHVQLRPGDVYGNDRLALCWDFVPAINAELRALVEAGADYIQLDEPSAAIVPGQIDEYVKMFNACVEGVRAKIAYHVCFGNLLSRPRGKRSYRWMFPALLDARCQQFVFEYANREMAEIEHWKEIGVDREVACGVVDVSRSTWRRRRTLPSVSRSAPSTFPSSVSRRSRTAASFQCRAGSRSRSSSASSRGRSSPESSSGSPDWRPRRDL